MYTGYVATSPMYLYTFELGPLAASYYFDVIVTSSPSSRFSKTFAVKIWKFQISMPYNFETINPISILF